MEEKKNEVTAAQDVYHVLVRVDTSGRIVDINSSAFAADTGGWVEIDSGWGDRYHHAQGNYLDKPFMDERGVYRYKLVDGMVVERTQDEMDADWDAMPQTAPTVEQRLTVLESSTDDIILMLADMIGG